MNHLTDELVWVDGETGWGLSKRRKTDKSHMREKVVESHDRLRPEGARQIEESIRVIFKEIRTGAFI